MSVTTTSLAIVTRNYGEPGELETVQVGPLQPDEALVEIHASGVCHTDMGFIAGNIPGGSLPAVFGHEGAGVILDHGAEVTDVSKGDKVLLSFAHCQKCDQCQSGMPGYCYDFIPRNFNRKRSVESPAFSAKDGSGCFGNFFGQSSFAQRTIVHRSSLVKVPSDTPLDNFAPMGCGMITGAGCVLNTLNVQPGGTLAVFGCGSVGMAAIMAGKIRKAKTIIAIDLVEDRLKLARELGATDTIRGDVSNMVEEFRKICPPDGVKSAIDTSGVPALVSTMMQCLGTRGRAASVGVPSVHGATMSVDIHENLHYGREYVGCTEGDSVPSQMIPYLLSEHSKGNFPIERIITTYEAEDFKKAFDDLEKGKAIKAILKWR